VIAELHAHTSGVFHSVEPMKGDDQKTESSVSADAAGIEMKCRTTE